MFLFARIYRVFAGILCLTALFLVTVGATAQSGEVTIIDARHYSNVFGETRNFRVFLPPGYHASQDKRYPVIYFYHGWSQRYFGSSNPYGDFDKGDENGGDNIANFVSKNEVIVVKADGYNRSPDENYYVRPYNVTPVETYRQFPIYFPELVSHVDSHFRTIADREHRGISGLSMGGFMTFWIGGKYPHLLSAAGNFCGSPEFEVGPKDFPVEYRHLDMYKNYGGMNVRLHYGDKDFIRGYHEDLNRVWPCVMDNYSYKIFDAAHSTCGLGEMFGFILKTFENPPAKPSRWHHTDVYPVFDVWGYRIMTDRTVPGFTVLENVDSRGFRISVRRFLPDGELLPSVRVTVLTAPLYEPNQAYNINARNMRTSKATQRVLRADREGRLTIELDGSTQEVGINRKSDRANVTIAATSVHERGWATAGEDVTLALTLVNKGGSDARNVRATVSPLRPTSVVTRNAMPVVRLAANQATDVTFTFQSTVDSIEIEKFRVSLRDDKKNEWVEDIEIPLKPKVMEIKNFIIADGQTLTVAKAGVDTERVTLGAGNGDGIANPGESIVILVREADTLRRTDLTGRDPYLNPFGINVRESDSWSPYDHVGGSAKYDVPLIASNAPQGHPIELAVEYWLPDYPLHIVRRGLVKFNITGKDETPPQIADLQVTGDNVLSVKLRDGSLIRSATGRLILENDPKKSIKISLADDGEGGDRAANDLLFSASIPTQVFGIFRIVIEAEDSHGNIAVMESPETFVLH